MRRVYKNLCPTMISASIMVVNMWKNSLKNVESDNNKILYETLLEFFYSKTVLIFWISLVCICYKYHIAQFEFHNCFHVHKRYNGLPKQKSSKHGLFYAYCDNMWGGPRYRTVAFQHTLTWSLYSVNDQAEPWAIKSPNQRQ